MARLTQENALSQNKVWRLAGPNIISNILMVSISFAHLWIVAPFGSEMSAAVVTGGRIHFLLMSAAMALSVATTAIVARAWGAEDTKHASAATTSSLILAMLISLLLGAITFFFAEQIIGFFKLDPVSNTLAIAYVKPAAILNVLFALVLTTATAFRAIGDVVRPLQYSAFATAIGIAGSYIFMHGSLGLPKLGIAGIPWGTAAGQACVLLWFSVWWLLKKYRLVPVGSALFDMRILKNLIVIGAPAALEQVIIQTSFVLFMVLVADYGTNAFAAYGIGITILSICIVVGMGFGAASAALSGQNLGARNPEAARANGWLSMKMATISMSIIAVVTLIFREPLAALLSIDPDVQQYTANFIIILAIIQPLMAIEFAIGSALRGCGETRFPLFVTFTGVIVGRFSFGYMVILLDGPVEAMYAVIIADYAIKALMLVLRFRSDRWLKSSDHAPLPVQSVAGFVRTSVRSYFGKRTDKNDNLSN
ncbi:MATE family efflux transporter [Kordiimonas aquimaris]|uniref:MATE family efflux transporter n=1 Tax=Kordiimonas aquimaris TaxID=707591 RepID=UPI0021D1874D|nr:MATE family efflux transporter [Kordiimonas aquimaris]